MKKSERLNQELFFLRTHPQFNLNQLMKTFGISKSTALRDIEALENLGVPLYVENGRYGGYRVLNKPLLPPIYFNENEVLAIFFVTITEISRRVTVWSFLSANSAKIIAFFR